MSLIINFLDFLCVYSICYSIVDPDGNVIFELHKWEIDDAHKDKQKMYHENFKVSFKQIKRNDDELLLTDLSFLFFLFC